MGAAAVDDGASPNQKLDPKLHDIVLVDQLPSDVWSEGIAVRPSGNVLTTSIDEPQLFVINSGTTGPLENEFDTILPKLVHSFDGADATGTFNICALRGTDREEYAVSSGHADLLNGKFHSWVIWRVVMPAESSDDDPVVSKIADVEGGGFLLGMESISDRFLVIADPLKGCIRRIDTVSGEASVISQDPALAPPGHGEMGVFGANRVRFTEKFGWAINTGVGTFVRFPVEWSANGDVKQTGPAEEITTGLSNADGLVMTRDGKSAYICSYASGHLWRIDMEGDGGSGKGHITAVRQDLVSPTGMELVYKENRAKPALYIICCGEVSDVILEGDRAAWVSLANLDTSKLQIRVTVTTEITYEYI